MSIQEQKLILLVEDDAIISLAQSYIIRQFGYKVITASSGEKAVTLAINNEEISLVLMDIDLGKSMDGTEAARQILSHRSIPIVFLTSHSEREMVEKVRNITRYGYIIKNSGDFVLQSSIEMAFELFEAHKKVQESEEQFKFALEGTNDGLWDINMKEQSVFLSSRTCEILGYPPEKYPSTFSDYVELIHPDDLVDINKALSDYIDGKSPIFQIEQRLKTMNGEWKWILARGKLVSKTSDNKPLRMVGTYTDISQRKLAEETLKISENKYRELIDLAVDGILVGSHEGIITEANECMCKITGLTKGELIGKHIGSVLFTSESLKKSPLQFHLLQKGEIVVNERTILHRDGSEIEVEMRSKMMTDGSYQSIYRDITKRKKAEEELLNTRILLEETFEQSPIPMILVSMPDTILRIVNPACREFLGIMDEPSYIGTSLMDYKASFKDFDTHGNLGLLEELPLARAIMGQKTSNEERIIVRKDGIIRWELVSGTPIYSAEGEIIAGYLTLTDITERKLIEQSLRQNQEIFTHFMKHNPIYVFFKDEQIRALSLSDNYEKLLGRPLEELLGKTMDELFPSDLAKAMIADDLRILYGDKEEHIDEEFNGRYYKTIKFPINIDNKQRYLAGYTMDITETKLGEIQIKKLLKEKELYLREVHHRIKNNLNTIVSFLSLQVNILKDPLAIAALNDSKSRVQSMGILYDKLYRSDIFNEMSIKEYLSPLVDEITGNFPNSASVKIEKNIDDLILDVNILLPVGILINELLTNAMKYAFEDMNNGLIRVSAFKESHIIIVIEDNGKGLPEPAEYKNSTGFGLRLVKMLSEQINARLEIKREKGTKFILELKK